jgi:hypothetical protein
VYNKGKEGRKIAHPVSGGSVCVNAFFEGKINEKEEGEGLWAMTYYEEAAGKARSFFGSFLLLGEVRIWMDGMMNYPMDN